MNRISKVVAALVVGAVCVGALAPRANAQDDPRDKKITLSLNDADVRDALKMLFKSVDVQYSIAPEVQGTVVVDLKGIPFETALRNILNQVNATYRVTGGIYEIILRETVTKDQINPSDPGTGPTTATKPLRRFKINKADPYLILLLLAGVVDTQGQPEYSALMKVGGGYGNNGNNGYGNNGNNGYGNNGYGNGGYGNNNFGGGFGNYGGGGFGNNGGFGNRGGGFGGGGFGGGNFGGGGGGFGGRF